MSKISISPEYFLQLLKNSAVPSIVFGAALIGCLAVSPLAESVMLSFHTLFYLLTFASFLTLLYFNRAKPAFFLLSLTLSYIFINYFKSSLGEEYLFSPLYQLLSLFIPLNLIVFFFLPQRRLLTKTNVYLLLAVFAEIALAEKLSYSNLLPWSAENMQNFAGLSFPAFFIFLAVLTVMFLRMSLTDTIGSAGLFYATFSVFLGFYYSASPTALTIFYSSSALIILLTVCRNIYYTTYKDVLTGLPERNSYLLNAKDFPLKYSLGIVCIDDYDKLRMAFGRMGVNALVKMIVNRLCQVETEAVIYRFSEDEFVIIFKNEDKNTGFDRLEHIRRGIASAEFILSRRRKPVKLTVSCSISEKKRSDANSVEVLVRARKALQKTYKFTQNVTTKA